jgi:hypothetical protein
MKGDIIPYQFGNSGISQQDFYIFQRANFNSENNYGLKINKQTSDLFEGEVKTTPLKRNLKGVYRYQITFNADTQYENERMKYLQKVFNQDDTLNFFYSFDDIDGLKIYYNLAQITRPIGHKYTEITEENGKTARNYNLDIECYEPYLLECDINDLYYVDDSTFNTSILRYDTGLQYDQGLKYDALFVSTHKSFTTSNLKNLDFVQDLFKVGDVTGRRQYSLYYIDRYLLRDQSSINTSSRKTYNLTSNNPLLTDTGTLDLNCTGDNRFFLIEFEPLAQGEWLKIENLDNGSDIVFNWNYAKTNRYNVIYNSYSDSFYNTKYGTEYSEENNLINFDFTSQKLYFNGLYTFNPFNPYMTNKKQNLRITKNTAGNLNVYLSILKTWH